MARALGAEWSIEEKPACLVVAALLPDADGDAALGVRFKRLLRNP
ncbi:MAG: hypothetical protein ACRDRO_23055 [Pseudonocardiaceae bacterium]